MISSQFLQSCQSGDEKAIETLVRTYQRGVFQLALSVIDDTPAPAQAGAPANPSWQASAAAEAVQEAEQATRETFIAALDRLGRYREEVPFETWLYSLAIRVSRRRYRRWRFRRGISRLQKRIFGRRSAPAGDLPPSGTASPAANVGNVEPAPPVETLEPDARLLPGDAALWTAVRGLPEKLRVAVVLRYYHDLPVSEVARLLNLNEGVVHARLDAAREQIAKALEG